MMFIDRMMYIMYKQLLGKLLCWWCMSLADVGSDATSSPRSISGEGKRVADNCDVMGGYVGI